jgi:fructokinase
VGRPLVLGEVLFDVMPDGTRVLGGAPFNVAWHLKAFGLDPLLMTRVGADEDGDEVLSAMESWGMDVSAVQQDDHHPTGRVQVELDNGEPTFHILSDQAYDYLDSVTAEEVAENERFALLYHGSLIMRSESSRSALDNLVKWVDVPIFVDVNLRDPWWSRDLVVRSAQRARWVKLNESELSLLAGGEPDASAARFRDSCDLEELIVTRGGRGAMVIGRSGTLEASPPGAIEIIDTVGAGDAFSAVAILGIARGWSREAVLERALGFAAEVCTRAGATTTDRSLYRGFGIKGGQK